MLDSSMAAAVLDNARPMCYGYSRIENEKQGSLFGRLRGSNQLRPFNLMRIMPP